MREMISIAVAAAILFSAPFAAAASPAARYHDTEALTTALRLLERNNAHVDLESLGETAGGRDLLMLKIGPTGASGDQTPPAVLVVGNPLGTTPLATEAALELARRILGGDISGRATGMAWYIVPSLDPDGAARFFSSPRRSEGANGRPVDDDNDGDTNEDGPDDLDGDGLVAQMLLPDPEGAWLLTDDEPRLARKADPAAGERGLYRLLTEGDDNDGDGLYNEDGAGGVVPGRNFPHAFEHWIPSHGPWAVSETESRALLDFAFDHPEILMVLILGEANTLVAPPGDKDTPTHARTRHKPPRWLARRTGLDPLTEYGLDELLPLVRGAMGMPNLERDDLLSMLNPGPATAPPPADRAWWDALSSAYGDSLAAAGLDAPRVAPPASVPGSVEAWAYYQFGVPTFALDFWTPPLPATAPTDSLADGTAAAPDSTAMKTTLDPALAALAACGDQAYEGRGVLPWREVKLDDGTTALVGGIAPAAMRTPATAMIDSLVSARLPFVLELPAWLPHLDGLDVDIEARGGDVWEVVAHVRNGGPIAYPTAQGKRCRRPEPVAVILEGPEVLEGRARQIVKQVPAMGSASVRWLVRGKAGSMIRLRASAPGFGTTALGVALQEKGDHR